MLEQRAVFLEFVDGVAAFPVVAEHTDVDVAVLEIGRQVDGVHGHELGGKSQLSRDEGAEFAQDEFLDSGGTVFHNDCL